MKRFARLDYLIAYLEGASIANPNMRVRLKELRFWNRAMSIEDFKLFDKVNLPPGMPELGAVFKFLNESLREEVYGNDNN